MEVHLTRLTSLRSMQFHECWNHIRHYDANYHCYFAFLCFACISYAYVQLPNYKQTYYAMLSIWLWIDYCNAYGDVMLLLFFLVCFANICIYEIWRGICWSLPHILHNYGILFIMLKEFKCLPVSSKVDWVSEAYRNRSLIIRKCEIVSHLMETKFQTCAKNWSNLIKFSAVTSMKRNSG